MDPWPLKNLGRRSILTQNLHSPFTCLLIFTVTSNPTKHLPALSPFLLKSHTVTNPWCWMCTDVGLQILLRNTLHRHQRRSGDKEKLGLLSRKESLTISSTEKTKVFKFFFFTIHTNCHQVSMHQWQRDKNLGREWVGAFNVRVF